ncbi:MAG: Gfo/Idh/MocA family oxidoreductase, partial [Phaeodactylibacter sp.]|nr:Gfo/Idh/MocA family oxidoreductase [Phaeodactylibacter sp.]
MSKEKQSPDNSRRRALKGLAGLPFVGGILIGAYAESRKRKLAKRNILEALNINATRPESTADMSGDPIRVGIIGFGGRGSHLVRLLGYATPSWFERMKEEENEGAIKAFQEQENLNVQLTGVCDVFDVYAEEAVAAFPGCKRYRNYEEMLESPDIDAVVIATPDHWHAPISIAALQANKHVYVEKPMTHNIGETYALQEAV